MVNKKKVLTSVVALGTAAALTLGGTFAWQSISQTALNEGSDIVNPGGRLHNDQHWVSNRENDTDIYVENFTDPDNGGEDIFARIRLEEYMEIVMNYGVDGAETVETVVGSKTPKEDSNYTSDDATRQNEFDYTYEIHKFDEENATKDFWKWTPGDGDSEEAYFIPTYNVNKDSLLPDLNGEYVDTVGGISNREAEQYSYTEVDSDTTADGYEVYDGDVNTADEVNAADLKDLIENGTDAANYEALKENVVLTEEKQTHNAAKIGDSKGLISMEEWLEMLDGEYDRDIHGGYWVYDTDGWVYWSSPIEAGTATGRLLDSISLKQVMDDTWYYAINVVAQFVTADDVGINNDTGFYDTEAGEVPSDDAVTLLEAIGVQFDEAADDDFDDEDDDENSLKIRLKQDGKYYGFELYKDTEYTIEITRGTEYSDETVTLALTFDGQTIDSSEYELGSSTLTFDESGVATTTLKITANDFIDRVQANSHKFAVLTATTDNETANYYFEASYEYTQFQCQLYDHETGTLVVDSVDAAVGLGVERNKVYDVVIYFEDDNNDKIVLIDSRDGMQITDRIVTEEKLEYSVTTIDGVEPIAYKDVNGRLCTEDKELRKFRIDMAVNKYTLWDNTANAEDSNVIDTYKGVIYRSLFPKGQEEITLDTWYTVNEYVSMWGEFTYMDVSEEGRIKNNFELHDTNGNKLDITAYTYTITGNTDENTKFEFVNGALTLTLGENETSEELTITADISPRGTVNQTVTIEY